jgi:hypothetical protein
MSCINYSEATDYGEWDISIHELSSHMSRENNPQGLLYKTQSEDQYAADEENFTEGVLNPHPVFAHPGPLTGTTAPQIAIHSAALKMYERDIAETEKLRMLIIESMGTDNAKACAHPLTGLRRVTIQQLMNHMRETFNIATTDTVNALTARLSHVMSSEDTIIMFINKFNALCNSLVRVGYPITDYDKIKYVTTALRSNAAATECIKSYIHENPLLSQRNFASLKAYLILHTPNNITVTTAGYANSASASLTARDVELLIEKALSKQRGGNKQIATGTKTVTASHKYCWRHGYGFTHDSASCKTMKNDTTGAYTAAHFKSTSPLSPPGGNDVVY